MTISIDLNADLGEGAGHDETLLGIVSSASIACGGHAGDDETIRQTLKLAHSRGVVCGAHPGFEDKENFGRKRLDLSAEQLTEQVRSQYTNFLDIAASLNAPVRYVKLHGAMANIASEDEAFAKLVFGTIARITPEVPILALDNSMQITASASLNLPIIPEAYADRAYTDNGMLVPRSQQGAVITDHDLASQRCIQLAMQGTITSITGATIPTRARSICLHGDTQGAVDMARHIKNNLENSGIEVRAAI